MTGLTISPMKICSLWRHRRLRQQRLPKRQQVNNQMQFHKLTHRPTAYQRIRGVVVDLHLSIGRFFPAKVLRETRPQTYFQHFCTPETAFGDTKFCMMMMMMIVLFLDVQSEELYF